MYTCILCKKVKENGWSNEDMVARYIHLTIFQNTQVKNLDICDECLDYQLKHEVLVTLGYSEKVLLKNKITHICIICKKQDETGWSNEIFVKEFIDFICFDAKKEKYELFILDMCEICLANQLHVQNFDVQHQ